MSQAPAQATELVGELISEAERYIPGGVNSSTRALNPPIVWTKAHGSCLESADGKSYIDYHAAFGPIILPNRRWASPGAP